MAARPSTVTAPPVIARPWKSDLLANAARQFDRVLSGELAQHGMTVLDHAILNYLGEHAGERVTHGKLARALGLDRATMTRGLRPLQRRTLVRVIADSDDRRRRFVLITSDGTAALEQLRPGVESVISRFTAKLEQHRQTEVMSALLELAAVEI